MAYSKTSWVDGETPVNATNLNKIESALEENADLIDQVVQGCQVLCGRISANSELQFTGSIALIVVSYSSANYGLWVCNNNRVDTYGTGTNNSLAISAENNVYTIQNLNASASYRYIVILGT